MNKYITTIAAGALVASMSSVALAQSTSITASTSAAISSSSMSVTVYEGGNAMLKGTVTGISGNTISVASWFGTYSIDASSAKIQRRYGDASSIGELQTGDSVRVWGTASQGSLSITASRVQDMTIYNRGVHPSGTVSGISASSSTFTLTTGGDNPQIFQVTANASTKIRVQGIGQATFTNLANGMTVQVWGTIDRNNKTITASSINARVRNKSRKSSRSEDRDDANMRGGASVQASTSLQIGIGH